MIWSFALSLEIWNRRYTGSKFKLVNWILPLMEQHCKGESFCDLFAGTGVLSAKVALKTSSLYINDILFSNEIIYKAFFLQESYNHDKINHYINKYSQIYHNKLEENYISLNYGGKFFAHDDALKIGYIREHISKNKKDLSEKEHAILLASLLYSADKSANTVGHYEAYIKNKPVLSTFKFIPISPYILPNCNIKIFRKNANDLAQELSSDIVYIDPPYNSRQYSRFYHVLENITTWEKPELFGEALKPSPENMSDYCRSSATRAFQDLINKLSCKYIVVSYNNTYTSKSSSSRNKIELEALTSILEEKGSLKIFEKSHQCFNAGKTEFNDHKEFIFIVKVK